VRSFTDWMPFLKPININTSSAITYSGKENVSVLFHPLSDGINMYMRSSG